MSIFEEEPEHTGLRAVPVKPRNVLVRDLVMFADSTHDHAVALQKSRRKGRKTPIILIMVSYRSIVDEHPQVSFGLSHGIRRRTQGVKGPLRLNADVLSQCLSEIQCGLNELRGVK